MARAVARLRRCPMPRISNIEILDLPLMSVAERVMRLADLAEVSLVFTPNVDHFRLMKIDHEFARAYDEATMRLPDGVPLKWMARWQGERLENRVAGADLFPALCRLAAERGVNIAIVGGGPGVAQQAAERMSRMWPNLRVVATNSPLIGFHLDQQESQSLVDLLNEAKAQIVFVCLGAPKQEKWVFAWRAQLPPGAYVCLGAAVDFAAGSVRRAPRWMQVIALEWLFRLMGDPMRLGKRYALDIVFLFQSAVSHFCAKARA